PAGRYSAAIMVVPGWSRSVLAARSAASKASGWVSHQFITRNRRVAVGLALVTVFISVAAVHLSEAWFSPGLLILPVLAGGLLLWPRALHILFAVIAAGLAYDVLMDRAGPGGGRRDQGAAAVGRVRRPARLGPAGGVPVHVQRLPAPRGDDRGLRHRGAPCARPHHR